MTILRHQILPNISPKRAQPIIGWRPFFHIGLFCNFACSKPAALTAIKTFRMKIYSVENLPGKDYEVLDVVTGSTVQSKNFISDFGQSLKNIVGGELKAYTQMMEKARRLSTERMVAQADEMRADAIIGVRYSTSAIMAQAAEVLVYGTAIRFK